MFGIDAHGHRFLLGQPHLDAVLSKVCRDHAADAGQPCWAIDSDHGSMRGVCAQRIRRSGFTGQPTERSSTSHRSPRIVYSTEVA